MDVQENCARCGHSIALHGRRGHGACRHGWTSPLEAAVETVRLSVALKLTKEQTHEAVEKAFNAPAERCECKRFRKTASKIEAHS